MNVISRPAIDRAIQRHPICKSWLERWWNIANSQQVQWTCLQDVRKAYSDADQVGNRLIFNATSGRRLIVGVRYADSARSGTLFVKHFLTHAEYDRGNWKG